MTIRFTTLLIGLLLAACAQLPKFDTTGVDKSLMPTHVSSDIKNTKGRTVIWGGTILSGKNLKDTTRLEVLAYPLDSDNWPERDQKPLGRFILSQKGYLETADYANGRVITLIGTVSAVEDGKVGKSPYTYPVIEARQLHLWHKSNQKSGTRFHFGVGVVVH